MSHEPQSINELKKQLQALLKFPDQNPNPVLKITMGDKLLYTKVQVSISKRNGKLTLVMMFHRLQLISQSLPQVCL